MAWRCQTPTLCRQLTTLDPANSRQKAPNSTPMRVDVELAVLSNSSLPSCRSESVVESLFIRSCKNTLVTKLHVEKKAVFGCLNESDKDRIPPLFTI
jgi:hypothetical protein